MTGILNVLVGVRGSSAPPVTSYANSGGTGDRTALITVTSTDAPSSGTLSNFVDGSLTVDAAGSVDFGSGAITNGAFIRFAFGAGVNKYIDEMKFASPAVQASMGAWLVQGSDSETTGYTTYGSFTWDDPEFTVTLTAVPSAGHRYWQLLENGSSNYPGQWLKEWEFKIAAGA